MARKANSDGCAANPDGHVATHALLWSMKLALQLQQVPLLMLQVAQPLGQSAAHCTRNRLQSTSWASPILPRTRTALRSIYHGPTRSHL